MAGEVQSGHRESGSGFSKRTASLLSSEAFAIAMRTLEALVVLVSQGIGVAAGKLHGLFNHGSRGFGGGLEGFACELLPGSAEIVGSKRSPDPGSQCENMAHVDSEG